MIPHELCSRSDVGRANHLRPRRSRRSRTMSRSEAVPAASTPDSNRSEAGGPSFTGPGWATLRPPPGTPFGTTAPHRDNPTRPRAAVRRLLADGTGYALASLLFGVIALFQSRSAYGIGLAVEAALVAAAIQFGRAAWRASVNTVARDGRRRARRARDRGARRAQPRSHRRLLVKVPLGRGERGRYSRGRGEARRWSRSSTGGRIRAHVAGVRRDRCTCWREPTRQRSAHRDTQRRPAHARHIGRAATDQWRRQPQRVRSASATARRVAPRGVPRLPLFRVHPENSARPVPGTVRGQHLRPRPRDVVRHRAARGRSRRAGRPDDHDHGDDARRCRAPIRNTRTRSRSTNAAVAAGRARRRATGRRDQPRERDLQRRVHDGCQRHRGRSDRHPRRERGRCDPRRRRLLELQRAGGLRQLRARRTTHAAPRESGDPLPRREHPSRRVAARAHSRRPARRRLRARPARLLRLRQHHRGSARLAGRVRERRRPALRRRRHQPVGRRPRRVPQPDLGLRRRDEVRRCRRACRRLLRQRGQLVVRQRDRVRRQRGQRTRVPQPVHQHVRADQLSTGVRRSRLRDPQRRGQRRRTNS